MTGMPAGSLRRGSGRRPPGWARRLAIGAALAAMAGCAATLGDLGYYWQSATGHLALGVRARPVGTLLEDPSLDPRLRAGLERAVQIRAFASRELGLPDNGSYRHFTDLGRPFVVWNVFAAPEFSLELRRWCFPVAGCVGYRGYFDQAAAEREAATLRAQGWDVFVAGIPAYSTLGWFDDPLLSSFVHYPEAELARLIFHELAHQTVYVKDDTVFNESFATAVERAGLRRWIAARADPALAQAHREQGARREAFLALLLRHRTLLAQAYREGGSPEAMRTRKAEVFAALRRGYADLRAGWGGHAGYDRWFGEALSNAQLASVAVYHDLVPAFEQLLERSDGDLPRFYAQVRALAALAPEARRAALGGPPLTAAR
jgi:predicted aminopeptidase